MESTRKPNRKELKLLEHLVKKAKETISSSWKNNLFVKPMTDGGMGSLLLLPSDITKINRLFGKQVSECKFRDKDGVEVIASLNVDNNGELFELDIWKTDYSSLIEIAEEFD